MYDKDNGVTGKLYRYDPEKSACDVVDQGPFTVLFF